MAGLRWAESWVAGWLRLFMATAKNNKIIIIIRDRGKQDSGGFKVCVCVCV